MLRPSHCLCIFLRNAHITLFPIASLVLFFLFLKCYFHAKVLLREVLFIIVQMTNAVLALLSVLARRNPFLKNRVPLPNRYHVSDKAPPCKPPKRIIPFTPLSQVINQRKTKLMNFATVCVSFWLELFPSLTSVTIFIEGK